MPRLVDTVICEPSMRYGAARCALGHDHRTVLDGEIRQQDDELVPTATTRGVGRTDAGAQAWALRGRQNALQLRHVCGADAERSHLVQSGRKRFRTIVRGSAAHTPPRYTTRRP
jgi:hypothetical protein